MANCCMRTTMTCSDGYWNHHKMVSESFQHILGFSQASCKCNGARRPWYRHPIYHQYWEQHDALKTSFEMLLNPFPYSERHCHHPIAEKGTAKRKSSHSFSRRGHRKSAVCDRSQLRRKYRKTSEERHGAEFSNEYYQNNANNEVEDSESDIDPDFLAFKIQSEQFKKERDLKKELSYEESVSSFKEDEESSKSEDEHKQMEEMYGENAPIIAAMEQACELNFKRYEEMDGYKLWPCMPLNP